MNVTALPGYMIKYNFVNVHPSQDTVHKGTEVFYRENTLITSLLEHSTIMSIHNFAEHDIVQFLQLMGFEVEKTKELLVAYRGGNAKLQITKTIYKKYMIVPCTRKKKKIGFKYQYIVESSDGVYYFIANSIVKSLYDECQEKQLFGSAIDLNKFDIRDVAQFCQLIGMSVRSFIKEFDFVAQHIRIVPVTIKIKPTPIKENLLNRKKFIALKNDILSIEFDQYNRPPLQNVMVDPFKETQRSSQWSFDDWESNLKLLGCVFLQPELTIGKTDIQKYRTVFFQANEIVQMLFSKTKIRTTDLRKFPINDRIQFVQLLGCSINEAVFSGILPHQMYEDIANSKLSTQEYLQPFQPVEGIEGIKVLSTEKLTKFARKNVFKLYRFKENSVVNYLVKNYPKKRIVVYKTPIDDQMQFDQLRGMQVSEFVKKWPSQEAEITKIINNYRNAVQLFMNQKCKEEV